MLRASNWLAALGGSVLISAGVFAAYPPAPVPMAAGDGASQPAAPVETPADPEEQRLLDQLSQMSEYIGRNSQSDQVWRYQLAEGDILLRLAIRSKTAEERNRWLRMMVDSHYSAAIQSPASDATAYQRLAMFPAQIARSYPQSPVAAYAALQEIQAEYNIALAKTPDKPAPAQERMCERLMRFANEYAQAPEAPKAVLDAAQMYEMLAKPDEARRCYRVAAEQFRGLSPARKAGGALARLGLVGEPVSIKLPLLFSAGEQTFDLAQSESKLVLVYFWSSTTPQAGEDLDTLKHLSDHHRAHGLEVVAVNMDAEPGQGRAFLSGRLTSGVHLFQRGGLDGPLAERYGIQSLPQTFLVSKEGKLIQQSQQPSHLEAEINGNLVHGR